MCKNLNLRMWVYLSVLKDKLSAHTEFDRDVFICLTENLHIYVHNCVHWLIFHSAAESFLLGMTFALSSDCLPFVCTCYILYSITSYHIMLYYIILYYIVLYYITSYHIIVGCSSCCCCLITLISHPSCSPWYWVKSQRFILYFVLCCI